MSLLWGFGLRRSIQHCRLVDILQPSTNLFLIHFSLVIIKNLALDHVTYAIILIFSNIRNFSWMTNILGFPSKSLQRYIGLQVWKIFLFCRSSFQCVKINNQNQNFQSSYFPRAGFRARSCDQKTQLEDVHLRSRPTHENTSQKQAYHYHASKNISWKLIEIVSSFQLDGIS